MLHRPHQVLVACMLLRRSLTRGQSHSPKPSSAATTNNVQRFVAITQAPTQQQRNNTTTQQQQHNNTTTQQQHNNTTTQQQNNNTTTQQHNNNNTTTQQHNTTTPQQHNNTPTHQQSSKHSDNHNQSSTTFSIKPAHTDRLLHKKNTRAHTTRTPHHATTTTTNDNNQRTEPNNKQRRSEEEDQVGRTEHGPRKDGVFFVATCSYPHTVEHPFVALASYSKR